MIDIDGFHCGPTVITSPKNSDLESQDAIWEQLFAQMMGWA